MPSAKAEAKKRVVALEPQAERQVRRQARLAAVRPSPDLKGTGVIGTRSTFSDTRSPCEVKLGFLLKPMAGKIREALERQIDKALT